MPLGWECRSKLLKQIPPKSVEPKGPILADFQLPGPNYYQPPEIFCGKGYSKIKRAPAYTFGRQTPMTFNKPAATLHAPMLNVQGTGRKGRPRIPRGVITPQIEPPPDKLKVPGPGAYAPRAEVAVKRPPAYTLRPRARPPYQPFDMWTPSPNMYCPPITSKAAPAYSLGYPKREIKGPHIPGPGEHEPNFNYVQKKKPAFSFGAPFRKVPSFETPAPNTYCYKKYNYTKPWPPAPSFGIRHSEYLGVPDVYEKPSKLYTFI